LTKLLQQETDTGNSFGLWSNKMTFWFWFTLKVSLDLPI